MRNTVAVGLGEIAVSGDPNDVLVAFGLGSCIGIGMFDPQARVAGLLHAILPTHPQGSQDHLPKYVDSGVKNLISQLIDVGANRNKLIIRMAGGANMLVAPGFSNTLNIGSRNVEAAHMALKDLNMKLSSEESGGNKGRTVRFYAADGRMTIRTVGNQEREI